MKAEGLAALVHNTKPIEHRKKKHCKATTPESCLSFIGPHGHHVIHYAFLKRDKHFINLQNIIMGQISVNNRNKSVNLRRSNHKLRQDRSYKILDQVSIKTATLATHICRLTNRSEIQGGDAACTGSTLRQRPMWSNNAQPLCASSRIIESCTLLLPA